MTIVALRLGAHLGQGRVLLGGSAESVHFLLRRVLAPEGFDEISAFVCHRADCLGPTMQEEFGHGWLVCVLNAAVEAIVSGLECHLHEGIGRKTHRRDEIFAVAVELENFEFVLLEEIREMRLGEPQCDDQLGRHVPFELARGGADVAEASGVTLGRIGAAGRPQARSLAIDGLGETEDGVGVEVAGEPENRVAVNTGVFEVDSRAAVLADDDLELVVPPVGAGADLHPADHFAGPAEHVGAQVRRALGLGVIQAKAEESGVDDVEALRVVRSLVLGQDVSHSRPHFPVLRAENAEGTFGRIVDWSLLRVVDDDL